jgi:hypothetical protein
MAGGINHMMYSSSTVWSSEWSSLIELAYVVVRTFKKAVVN